MARRRSAGTPAPDNSLSFTDQMMFLGQRATGQELVMQAVWIYERAVDLDELRRFHRDFGHGLMGRRIQPSSLPFGRHRWVSCPGPQSGLDIAATPRPRAELSDWADERAQLPLDPEWGPGWHMAVQPLADGSTAVSLVVSHCIVDGGGFQISIINTVNGDLWDVGYPPPRQRVTMRNLRTDLGGTVRALPDAGRALASGARQAFRRRHEIFAPSPQVVPAAAATGPDRDVLPPAVWAYVDLEDWDLRAKVLGGNKHSLLAGFAARLSQRMGRVRASDGIVTLNIPFGDRSFGDDRANAVLLVDVSVDPAEVDRDLSVLRTAIRDGVKAARETPDEIFEVLPLVPFVPKAAVRRSADALFGFSADLPVSVSNMAGGHPAVYRIDGTDADYMMVRGVDRHVTDRFLDLRRGLLTIVGGWMGGKVTISVIAWRPGAENTKEQLRQLVAEVLSDFELSGVIE
jgi:hypothetical protein